MQAKLVHKRVTLSRTTQLRLLCQYCALYCQSAKPKHQWNKSCWILPWAIHHTECITKQTQLCVQGAPNVGDHIENKEAFSISRSNLINHLSKLANILIKMSKSVFHHVNPLYKKSDFLSSIGIGILTNQDGSLSVGSSCQLCCHWNKRWPNQKSNFDIYVHSWMYLKSQ